MKLIGMLDSPYVRRVAISLQLLGLSFEHQPLSVFSAFDRFREINPVVKAPTLVCDDGTVLMDSTLILQYAESIAPERSLLPSDPRRLLQSLRVTGLALAACEKSVQVVYERKLRPRTRATRPGWSGSAASCWPLTTSWSGCWRPAGRTSTAASSTRPR
ncbi:putative glutathione S-transferase [Chromobacterium violaceum]|uniref:Putative glutathione S-transferase n=1 Tax=Chromobacterium violaceum TaxID=536 RepID=A0A447TGB0_CHRVL|nr:putative glutathione S-transferase [Chromobacterium violaceum]